MSFRGCGWLQNQYWIVAMTCTQRCTVWHCAVMRFCAMGFIHILAIMSSTVLPLFVRYITLCHLSLFLVQVANHHLARVYPLNNNICSSKEY